MRGGAINDIDLTLSLQDDCRSWDGTEPVTLEHSRRLPPVPPAAPSPLARQSQPGVYASPHPQPHDVVTPAAALPEFVAVAKGRAPSWREQAASGGGLTAQDRVWLLPAALLVPDSRPKPGDAVIDARGERWTVLEAAANKLRQTWRLVTRNLAVIFDLADRIDVQRAALVTDAAGVMLKQFPPQGGTTLYANLPARVQPVSQDVQEERGIRGGAVHYDIYCDRDLDLDVAEDRILWQGYYLDLQRVRTPASLSDPFVIEAVRKAGAALAVPATVTPPAHDFAPTDLPGLVLWLKADAGTYQDSAGTTPALADGDPVGLWQDQSGRGNHPAQAVSAKRPTLRLAVKNGLPVVRADGVDDFLSRTFGVALAQPFTVFLVFKEPSVSGNLYLYDGAGGNTAVFHKVVPEWQIYAGGAGNVVVGGATDQNWHVMSVEWSGASTRYRFDGSAEATAGGSPGANALDGLTLFSQGGGANYSAADVGEAVVCAGALAAATKARLFDYLNGRWGVY